MLSRLKDLVLKPMITGIAAGAFPTLIVLYGVNQSIGDLRMKEQLLQKQADDHAALLQEKVELNDQLNKLQENYTLLIAENTRLDAGLKAAVARPQLDAAPNS